MGNNPLPPTAWRFAIGRVKCPHCGWGVMVLGPAVQIEVRLSERAKPGEPGWPHGWTMLHGRCGKVLEFRLRQPSPLPAAAASQ